MVLVPVAPDLRNLNWKAVTAMGMTSSQIRRDDLDGENRAFNEPEKAAVLNELNAILNSAVFQTSKRGQQFLSYVVRHRLDGNNERLKERTIGVDLFQRPPGYATGDDPVVRVQAGEVRRRLEQYYQANTNTPAVRIELHVGSYTPEFRWAHPEPQADSHPALEAVSESLEASERVMHPHELVQVEMPSRAGSKTGSGRSRWILSAVTAVAIVLLAGLAVFGATIYIARMHQAALRKFWAPALSSSEPVLICLAKPSVYLPSVQLYQRHTKTPEKFLGQFARLSQKPELQPDDKLLWSDLVEYPDYGLASGDVYTAIRLSGLFGQIEKPNQVRIGGDYSFEDLRSSPAVVIGAYNNRWTMQMTSSLHFAFVDEGDQSLIREEGPAGRRFYSKDDANGNALDDYAVVTRLVNSRTGQFVVIVAGIRSYGTQAAGEFVSNSQQLQAALQAAPPGWEKKNLQIVLETQVTDGLPSPAQVVAFYAW